ncbi:hypothetical protein [Cellulomonas sp. ATA003]|uniref:hypothetical protein n=1 Tax=Cellulomonas sp. ATA003 TaxID=3073064 RepID=UPI0028739DD0|nr:hypothetical protein [Cellulomonas sp. ATA003]WNB86383.1 hypothetical protein REH70_03815 [Cellulomonas sp. ATA003]
MRRVRGDRVRRDGAPLRSGPRHGPVPGRPVVVRADRVGAAPAPTAGRLGEPDHRGDELVERRRGVDDDVGAEGDHALGTARPVRGERGDPYTRGAQSADRLPVEEREVVGDERHPPEPGVRGAEQLGEVRAPPGHRDAATGTLERGDDR